MLVGARTNARMGFERALLLVSCSRFIFGEGIRGSDFQSRTLATSYRVLSEAVVMRPKTSSGKHGIRTHMAIETARFSKSARQTVFDYFPFSQARPQGFEPRPTGLESVMLPLHQGRGVFDSVFGFRCAVCSVQCAVCSVQNFDFEHCFFISAFFTFAFFLLSFLKRKP